MLIGIVPSIALITCFALIFTIFSIREDDLKKKVLFWEPLTEYFILSSLIFVFHSLMETLEWISRVTSVDIEGIRHDYYLFLSLAIILVNLNYTLRLGRFLNVKLNLPDLLFGRFGIVFLYASVFWLLSLHISEFHELSKTITFISDFVYTLSIPIIFLILRAVIVNRRLEDEDYIIIPFETIDKSAGVSLSFSLLSIGILMLYSGYEDVYEILELFSLVTFVVSGESFRRDSFELLKLLRR